MVPKTPLGLIFLAGLFFLHETISYYWGIVLHNVDPEGKGLMAHMPDWQVLAGLACLFVAGVLYWRSKHKNPQLENVSQELIAEETSTPVPMAEHIYSRIYKNEIVQIDNKHFHDCHFEQVRFRWDGGGYVFSNAFITPPNAFVTYNQGVKETIHLCKFLGFLEHEFAANLMDIPPENPNG